MYVFEPCVPTWRLSSGLCGGLGIGLRLCSLPTDRRRVALIQMISGSVGEGGANEKHDVALLQAILLKTTRAAAPVPSSGTCLATYRGICGKDTWPPFAPFRTITYLCLHNGSSQSTIRTPPQVSLPRTMPHGRKFGSCKFTHSSDCVTCPSFDVEPRSGEVQP